MKKFAIFLSLLGVVLLFESILYGLDIRTALNSIEEIKKMGIITSESVQIFRIWLGLIIRIMLSVGFLGLGIYIEKVEKAKEKKTEKQEDRENTKLN